MPPLRRLALAVPILLTAGAGACGSADNPANLQPGRAPAPVVATPAPPPVVTTAETIAVLPEPVPEPPTSSPVLDHMPSGCDATRAYVSVERLGAELARSFDLSTAKWLIANPTRDVFTSGLEALRAEGLTSIGSIKEIAFCGRTDDKKSIVVVRVDLSGLKDPALAFSRIIARTTGKKPARSEDKDVVWLTASSGEVLGIARSGLLFFGKDRAGLRAAASSTGGGSEFQGSLSNVVWVKSPGSLDVAVRDMGGAFDVELLFSMPHAIDMKPTFDAMLSQLETATMGPLSPLLPALKGAQFEAIGDVLRFKTRFPKRAVLEVVEKLGDTSGGFPRGLGL